MVRIGAGKADSKGGNEGKPIRNGSQSPRAAPAPLVIHAGDALVVEEHSYVVDGRLQATALGSAAAGSEFEARLKIGGKVVLAVALEAGRAEMMPEREAQP